MQRCLDTGQGSEMSLSALARFGLDRSLGRENPLGSNPPGSNSPTVESLKNSSPSWWIQAWSRLLTGIQALLLALIIGYQRFLSPLKPPMCRFYPTCSAYAYESIHQHGVGTGLTLTVKRLCKCHPFHPGGMDPVPSRKRPEKKTETV